MNSDHQASRRQSGLNEHGSIQTLNQAAGILTLLLLAFTAVISWYSWNVEKDYYVGHLESIAELETKALDMYFQGLQMELKGLGEDIVAQHEPLDLDNTYLLVKRFGDLHPDLANVTLVQPDGKVLLTAHTPPHDTTANLAPQTSFKEFLASIGRGQTFAIGRPVMGAVLGKAIVPLRLAVMDAHGMLRFILSAALPQEHLRSFWMDAPIVGNASIGVLRDDGFLLSRYPVPDGIAFEQLYGQPGTGALMQHLTQQGFPQRGQVQGPGALGGADYLNIFRRFSDFPMTLFVAVPMTELKASWWRRSSGTYLALFVLQFGVLFAYRYAVRRQRSWNQKRRRFEEALHQSERHLRAIVQSEPECIKTVDARGNLTEMNPAGLAMIEADSIEQVRGHPVADLIVPEYRKAFADMHARVIAGQSAQLEFEVIGLKGGRRWLETHAVPLQEGGETVQLALTRDITQRKSMEDQVRQLAFHDPLTSLPNRRLLLDRLNQAMAASRRSGRYAAIIFLDLDHFKPLNDAHGHEAGDLLLIEVADRLAHCVREIDTVARFGGDEFVVMLTDLNADKEESIAQAQAIAEKIRIALAEPYQMTVRHGDLPPATVVHRCTASIGVALFINHEGSADDILSWADSAMYAAKEAGRNLVRFHAMGPHQDWKISGTNGLPP